MLLSLSSSNLYQVLAVWVTMATLPTNTITCCSSEVSNKHRKQPIASGLQATHLLLYYMRVP